MPRFPPGRSSSRSTTATGATSPRRCRSSRRTAGPGVLNLDLSNLAPSWGIPRAGVRRLIAAGWEIDAHSMTHADLAAASGAALAQEVAGSRRGDPPPLRGHATVLLLPRGPLRRRERSRPSRPPGSRERRRPRSGSRRPSRRRLHARPGAGRPRRRSRRPGRKLAALGLPRPPRVPPASRTRSSSLSVRPVPREPRTRQRHQLLEVAAELAALAAHDRVRPRSRDDRRASRLEGDSGQDGASGRRGSARGRPSAVQRRADIGPAVTSHRPSGLNRASATDAD